MLKTIRTIPCGVDDVYVPQRHRKQVDQKEYEALRDDIKLNGLQTPITVRIVDVPDWNGEGPVEDGIVLVAGFNRLQAMKEIGQPDIMCTFVEGTDDEVELWEIAENLKRCKLVGIEFGEHVARYDVLSARISRPGDEKSVGRPKGGNSQTARELGISEPAVRRAKEIAGLSDKAKDTAREVGLDKATHVLADAKRQGAGDEAKEVAILRAAAVRRENERQRKELIKANAEENKIIALTEAEQFAEWIFGNTDLNELPKIISWVTGTKPADVAAALRRMAA